MDIHRSLLMVLLSLNGANHCALMLVFPFLFFLAVLFWVFSTMEKSRCTGCKLWAFLSARISSALWRVCRWLYKFLSSSGSFTKDWDNFWTLATFLNYLFSFPYRFLICAPLLTIFILCLITKQWFKQRWTSHLSPNIVTAHSAFPLVLCVMCNICNNARSLFYLQMQDIAKLFWFQTLWNLSSSNAASIPVMSSSEDSGRWRPTESCKSKLSSPACPVSSPLSAVSLLALQCVDSERLSCILWASPQISCFIITHQSPRLTGV